MFRYYLALGFRNLRRNPALTALMVLTLAVGIAACMSTLTVLYVMSGDPIPHKSDRLFVPQLDNYPASYTPQDGEDEPDNQMTYRDAAYLVDKGPGVRRAAMYGINAGIETGRKDLAPMEADGLATGSDFFRMFEVPFKYGAPWDRAQDAAKAPVMVLSTEMSEKLFGAGDPTGKRVRMRDTEFTVIGMVDEWKPLPRYYRLINGNGGSFAGEDQVFIPFSTAVALEMDNNGSNNCSDDKATAPGWQGWLDSECTWIQFWFEGASAADQAAIHGWLDSYVAEQKKLGRFPRPPNNRLRNVREWMTYLEVVEKDSKLSTWLSFGFLLVCLVNTIGLLLAKFSARAGEVGVRRALGAPRSEIFRQYLVEAGVVGLIGGVVGLALSFGGLWVISQQSETMEAVARMDWVMLATTLALALVASLVAGLLPTWRACQVTPALQLKSQ